MRTGAPAIAVYISLLVKEIDCTKLDTVHRGSACSKGLSIAARLGSRPGHHMLRIQAPLVSDWDGVRSLESP